MSIFTNRRYNGTETMLLIAKKKKEEDGRPKEANGPPLDNLHISRSLRGGLFESFHFFQRATCQDRARLLSEGLEGLEGAIAPPFFLILIELEFEPLAAQELVQVVCVSGNSEAG